MPPQTGSNYPLWDVITKANSGTDTNRVFALMGPNGAGKSRLMKSMFSRLRSNQMSAFFLPSDRSKATGHGGTQTVGGTVSTTSDLIQQEFRRLLNAHATNGYSESLLNLIANAKGRDQKHEGDYNRDAILYADGKLQERPQRLPKLIESIPAIVHELLGYNILLDQGADKIVFAPRGTQAIPRPRAPYRPAITPTPNTFRLDGLSDGEKQTLGLITFLISRAEQRFFFLVDEPELYLNEVRATHIWSSIEANFPNAVFLYATHNISFATRETVDATYLMRMDGNVEIVDRTKPIPATVIREIVGTRLQLLRSSRDVVFCEDELSQLFLEDLLSDQSVQPIDLGGSEQVRMAVQGDEGWSQVRSQGVRFCGIIDRDARDSNEVVRWQQKGIVCLPVYDAEAILLEPEMAVWSMSRSARRSVSMEEYRDILVQSAKERVEITLNSIRSHLCWSEKPNLMFASTDTGVTNVRAVVPSGLEQKFIDRAREVHEAIQNRDERAILRLVFGKFLYESFCRNASEKLEVQWPKKNPTQMYADIRAMTGFREVVAKIPWVDDFKKKICACLDASNNGGLP
jgi:energy-coupling factor transporter ATP-binding protein EcfA2